jgi:uncharacterized membrane protein
MSEFSTSIEIQATPDHVWAILSDVARWPEWTPSVTSVERVDSGPLVRGSRAWLKQPKLRRALWHVTDVHEGRAFTWQTESPGVRAVGRHTLEPVPGGCRLTLSVRFEGPLARLVAFVTRGMNRRNLAQEAAGLKERSERPPGPRLPHSTASDTHHPETR